jgi:asparagine synthase (glutamine-hydrolysing)
MCAIIGALPSCNISTNLLRHRGPDGDNIVTTPNIVFGHSRLAILDLTERAAQPRWDSANQVLLSYNGEIYNFRTLGRQAETSDTVALSQWLAAQGPSFDASLLDGMYAFAAWFRNSQKLVLCRDLAGIKPLYIAFGPDRASLAFASEMKGFFGVEWFVPAPNMDAEVQQDFLQYGYALPRSVKISWRGRDATLPLIPTLMEGVFQLCPGQTLTISPSSEPVSRFTTLRTEGETPHSALEAAVVEQSISDVEVGVQLSGGIDSSLVAWQFARAHPSVHGFYVSVPGEMLNEDKWAARAAETIGRYTQFNFHQIAATEAAVRRVLATVVWHMDEPAIRHPNAIGVFLLCEHVRQKTAAKVLLTGEGADEIFAGYPWHDGRTIDSYDQSRRVFDLRGSPAARRLMAANSARPVLERQLQFDRTLYLPPILARQDRMSMAHGIETRVPFLANRFLRLPAPLAPGKHALKRTAAEIFGHDFALRPKCGFGFPVEWLAAFEPPPGSLDWMRERPRPESLFQHWALAALGFWATDFLNGGWKKHAATATHRTPSQSTISVAKSPVCEPRGPQPTAHSKEREANHTAFDKLLRGEQAPAPASVLRRDGKWVEALAAGCVWRLDDSQYLDNEILRHGVFERDGSRFVHQLVKSGMVVCDVGANFGYYTLQLSRLVGPTGCVHTFEPSTRFRERLAGHLQMNDCQNVRLCEFGLGDRATELILFGGGDSATLGWHDDAKTPIVQELIRLRTLDDYVAEIGFDRLDFVKVDIDGAEPLFLMGAHATLRRYRPALLMEFMQLGLMEFKRDAITLARELSALGYVLAPENTGQPWSSRASFLRDAQNCSHSINVIALPAPADNTTLLLQQKLFEVGADKTREFSVPTPSGGSSRSPKVALARPSIEAGKLTDVPYWDRERAAGFTPSVVSETCFSALFEKYLPVNGSFTCAEIGAYPGTFLCDLAKRRGYQPIAIEYSEHTAHIEAMFRANGIGNGRVIREDFFKVRGEQFDVVVSFGFIEHFTNPGAVVARHFDLLKPGGWLVISVPRLDGFQGLLYKQTYTPETYARVAEAHNVEILNLHSLRRACEPHGEIAFADYVQGASVYFDWKASFVRPECRWLVRFLNQLSAAGGDRMPSAEFYSPHIFLVARKSVTPKPSIETLVAGLLMRARQAISRNDLGAAQAALRECVGLDSGLIEAHAALADVLAAAGNYAEAISVLESAPKSMPHALDIWNSLGSLRLACGELNKAELAFLEAIAWDPQNPDTLSGLLALYTKQQRAEEATAVQAHMTSLSALKITS